MLIRKNGIYKTIEPSEFGIYQKAGYEKVINEPLPKLEEVEPIVEDEPIAEVVDEEPIKEVIQDEPIDEIVDEMPKSKKNRRIGCERRKYRL
jgi:hypothetical protein